MPPQIYDLSDSYSSGFNYWNSGTVGTTFNATTPTNAWPESLPTVGSVGLWSFETVGFQVLKQDSTKSDPLTVTMDDPAWTEFASVGPRNVPGYTGPNPANSFIATRWFARQRAYATAPVYPAGTVPASCFWAAAWNGYFGVVPQITDLYVASSTTGVAPSYTFTPSVTGLCVSHFFNGTNVNMNAVACVAGTEVTVSGTAATSYDFVVFTLQALSGWGVNTISW